MRYADAVVDCSTADGYKKVFRQKFQLLAGSFTKQKLFAKLDADRLTLSINEAIDWRCKTAAIYSDSLPKYLYYVYP